MKYKADDGEIYTINLIDTPGHVDFTYEVSRSLAACEGAILVVDASQGIEAQTLSNIYLAMENDLTIIPVMNKVDLPAANPEAVAHQISDLLGVDPATILTCSAKTGVGVKEILEQVIKEIPAPKSNGEKQTKALVFDSVFDSYRGAIAYIRVFEGSIKLGDKIKFMKTDMVYEITEIGVLGLKRVPTKELETGQVGYIIASLKNISDIHIGDTITLAANPAETAIPGYKVIKPMVFSGLYPIEKVDYDSLRNALEKLALNDSSLNFVPESSEVLGFGFRTGFLGLLHMDITQERLSREFGVDIITTIPNVVYKIEKSNGDVIEIERPGDLPNPAEIEAVFEPISKVQIITPTTYTGAIMKLCDEKRGLMETMEYLDTTRVTLHYKIPMQELIVDFFDRLKSVSSGYASMDYEIADYQKSNMIKLDILVNGELVDAFSCIIHRDKAYNYGNFITERLRDLIPRQQFQIAIQAAIGGKIIARSTVKAFRKDVTAKCYGGDISRKRKLLEKQKEGKKRMKQIGSVEIPQKAFLAVLKRDGNE
jgi:GTP-binding protein LepA